MHALDETRQPYTSKVTFKCHVSRRLTYVGSRETLQTKLPMGYYALLVDQSEINLNQAY